MSSEDKPNSKQPTMDQRISFWKQMAESAQEAAYQKMAKNESMAEQRDRLKKELDSFLGGEV